MKVLKWVGLGMKKNKERLCNAACFPLIYLLLKKALPFCPLAPVFSRPLLCRFEYLDGLERNRRELICLIRNNGVYIMCPDC